MNLPHSNCNVEAGNDEGEKQGQFEYTDNQTQNQSDMDAWAGYLQQGLDLTGKMVDDIAFIIMSKNDNTGCDYYYEGTGQVPKANCMQTKLFIMMV